jgi:hypothetical protein
MTGTRPRFMATMTVVLLGWATAVIGMAPPASADNHCFLDGKKIQVLFYKGSPKVPGIRLCGMIANHSAATIEAVRGWCELPGTSEHEAYEGACGRDPRLPFSADNPYAGVSYGPGGSTPADEDWDTLVVAPFCTYHGTKYEHAWVAVPDAGALARSMLHGISDIFSARIPSSVVVTFVFRNARVPIGSFTERAGARPKFVKLGDDKEYDVEDVVCEVPPVTTPPVTTPPVTTPPVTTPPVTTTRTTAPPPNSGSPTSGSPTPGAPSVSSTPSVTLQPGATTGPDTGAGGSGQRTTNPGLDTRPLMDFLRNNIINVMILVVAIGLLILANRGDYRQAMSRIGVLVLGLFVLGLAISGRADDIGSWLLGLVTG